MSDRFEQKVAVVTGGVSGIGAQITTRLVSEGARVVAVDISEEAVAAATETFGESVVGHLADVTDETSYEAAIERAVSEFGQLDLLFNVAGGSKAAPLTEMTYADWDFTIRLNLYSVFLGTQLAARKFLASGRPGAIVNIASLNSLVPLRFGAGYSASKSGSSHAHKASRARACRVWDSRQRRLPGIGRHTVDGIADSNSRRPGCLP